MTLTIKGRYVWLLAIIVGIIKGFLSGLWESGYVITLRIIAAYYLVIFLFVLASYGVLSAASAASGNDINKKESLSIAGQNVRRFFLVALSLCLFASAPELVLGQCCWSWTHLFSGLVLIVVSFAIGKRF